MFWKKSWPFRKINDRWAKVPKIDNFTLIHTWLSIPRYIHQVPMTIISDLHVNVPAFCNVCRYNILQCRNSVLRYVPPENTIDHRSKVLRNFYVNRQWFNTWRCENSHMSEIELEVFPILVVKCTPRCPTSKIGN